MKREEALHTIPPSGFLKVAEISTLNDKRKTALNRKGNELFNNGDYDTAKRIFITTGYTDGLIRMGDYYMNENRPIDALHMYWLAPSKEKRDMLVERMASVIQEMISQKKTKRN